MPRFVEIADKSIVDLDTLTSLEQRDGEWYSSSTEGCEWLWDEEDVPVIRAAMMGATSINRNNGAFVCQYCGAPNIVEEE